MSNIVKLPSNDLYMRIQSNTVMEKQFKKSVLNMYKRHPSVTEKTLDVIDTVVKRRIVPPNSILTDGIVYYRGKDDIDLTDNLYTDILEKYQTYLVNANNLMAIVLNFKWKKLPKNVMYFLFEMEDGTFKELYIPPDHDRHR